MASEKTKTTTTTTTTEKEYKKCEMSYGLVGCVVYVTVLLLT